MAIVRITFPLWYLGIMNSIMIIHWQQGSINPQINLLDSSESSMLTVPCGALHACRNRIRLNVFQLNLIFQNLNALSIVVDAIHDYPSFIVFAI